MILGACAHITPRDNPPDEVFTTATGVDQTVGCLVASLDRAVSGVSHSASALIPGSSYEIRPTKDLIITGEVYFVRAEQAGAGSKVEVYALSTWAGKIEAAVAPCRTA